LAGTLLAAAAARKSALCLNRSMGTTRAALALASCAQPLAPACAACRDDFAATGGGHSGAITVTALAHELARLVGPLHETSPLVAARRRGMERVALGPGIWPRKPGFSGWRGGYAAYKGGRPCSSMRPPGPLMPGPGSRSDDYKTVRRLRTLRGWCKDRAPPSFRPYTTTAGAGD
jgi:hypothetical protein